MELPTSSQPNSDTSNWPRRTAKACASCRRCKIRCDGARPCAGCVKKGFPAGDCIDGCEHCRRARVRCEGGKPCQRCRDSELECVDELPNNATRDSSITIESRTPRRYFSDRAKLACQSCRRDNKKCDDQRPCSRCITRSEECVHVGRGPKLVKLRCEACRRENKKCEDSRPCKYCVDNGRACVSVERKGGGHGTRVKAACTNCRRDKIRCDGNRPCSACSRKMFACSDRACKVCMKSGKELECTHRRPPERETIEDDTNAAASSSARQLPSPIGPIPHHLQHPHDHYTLGAMPYYPPSAIQPPVGPDQLSPVVPQVMYQTEQRPAYFPVIDPNIDGPPHVIAAESSQQAPIPSASGDAHSPGR